MDPSSGRDKPLPRSESESDNPFSKFRRFADSQVSSLLQGIIGLPSAFSKNPPGDGRWADIDEDLRRRDQLQSRRQQLRDAEATNPGGKPAQLEDRVPVEQASKRDPSQMTENYRPYWEKSDDQNKTTGNAPEHTSIPDQGIPLYSKVTQDFFRTYTDSINSLVRPAHPAWLDADIAHVSSMLEQNPFGYSSPHVAQFIAFHKTRGTPLLHSDYSLLPYLLFSPYSPLTLSTTIPESCTAPIDRLRYFAAFEDLIRTTQGIEDSDGDKRSPVTPATWSVAAGGSASRSWDWIFDLYERGLLQQKFSLPSTMVSLPMNDKGESSIESQAPLTELEVFERLFRLGLEHSGPLGSLLGFFDDKSSPNEGHHENGLFDLIAEARKRLEEESRRQEAPNPSQGIKPPKTPQPSGDRIVSTSTTTESTTHEDGTRETCVTVWKQYADGRETTTTTSHIEDPSRDEHRDLPWSRGPEAAEQTTEKKDEKKTEKKGWFWN